MSDLIQQNAIEAFVKAVGTENFRPGARLFTPHDISYCAGRWERIADNPAHLLYTIDYNYDKAHMILRDARRAGLQATLCTTLTGYDRAQEYGPEYITLSLVFGERSNIDALRKADVRMEEPESSARQAFRSGFQSAHKI